MATMELEDKETSTDNYNFTYSYWSSVYLLLSDALALIEKKGALTVCNAGNSRNRQGSLNLKALPRLWRTYMVYCVSLLYKGFKR